MLLVFSAAFVPSNQECGVHKEERFSHQPVKEALIALCSPVRVHLTAPRKSTILRGFVHFKPKGQMVSSSLIPHLLFHLLSLQYDLGAASSAEVRSGDGKQLEVGGAAGSTVKDLSEIKDPREMKALVSGRSFFFSSVFFKGSVHPNYNPPPKKKETKEEVAACTSKIETAVQTPPNEPVNI